MLARPSTALLPGATWRARRARPGAARSPSRGRPTSPAAASAASSRLRHARLGDERPPAAAPRTPRGPSRRRRARASRARLLGAPSRRTLRDFCSDASRARRSRLRVARPGAEQRHRQLRQLERAAAARRRRAAPRPSATSRARAGRDATRCATVFAIVSDLPVPGGPWTTTTRLSGRSASSATRSWAGLAGNGKRRPVAARRRSRSGPRCRAAPSSAPSAVPSAAPSGSCGDALQVAGQEVARGAARRRPRPRRPAAAPRPGRARAGGSTRRPSSRAPPLDAEVARRACAQNASSASRVRQRQRRRVVDQAGQLQRRAPRRRRGSAKGSELKRADVVGRGDLERRRRPAPVSTATVSSGARTGLPSRRPTTNG